jgi:hypothetical protein
VACQINCGGNKAQDCAAGSECSGACSKTPATDAG